MSLAYQQYEGLLIPAVHFLHCW